MQTNSNRQPATLSFWGGVGTVTGSKYLLEANDSRILVDCGLFQGLKELRERNWQDPPFAPKRLDAVLLTHAHIDHTGYLPRLVKQGFRGPVYCSRATAALLRILLPDSGRLQEEEADYRNRHRLTRHQPARPLYTEDEAYDALTLLHPLPDSTDFMEIAPGIQVTLRNAGHILGSRFALVEIHGAGEDGTARRILFSGDLGSNARPILPDAAPPLNCDYLLVEATYGDRLHDAEDPKETLARIINAAVPRHAPILIPAFAVGRTQELIYLLRELENEGRIPILPVCIDSPMAATATRIYNEMTAEHDEEFARLLAAHGHPLKTHSMIIASSRDESKRLNELEGTHLIISAAGMMTGGRVLHHAQRVLPDPQATLVIAGFQAEGTTGRRIVNGERTVKVMKQWVPVRCHVEKIKGMSAHADWSDVLHWLEGLSLAPQRVFVTHGEPKAADAMREHIVQRFGWSVTVPQWSERFELR
jgi:metallo-beta-lactamase family protein